MGKNKPLNILFVTHSGKLYGAERSLLTLILNLDRKKFNPFVCLPEKGPFEEALKKNNVGYRYVYLPVRNNNTPKFIYVIKLLIFTGISFFRVAAIIRKEKIDVVYTNTMINLSGALAAMLLRKPHVLHMREYLPGNDALKVFVPYGIILRFILFSSKFVIANSIYVASQFSAYKGNEKVKVVYNGFSLSEIEDKCGRAGEFARMTGNGVWAAAVLASIQPAKGQELAVKAVHIAAKKIPALKLIIAGSGRKQYEDDLKKLVDGLDLNDRIIFTGFTEDVGCILSNIRVLIAPSVEPFGRTAVEGMLAGLPVIGVNRGGMVEIVEDGKTGFLAKADSPEDMAEKLVILYENEVKRSDMGKIGKHLAENKFSISKYISGIEAVLSGVFVA